MNEDRIREIAREEIERVEQEKRAAAIASADQFKAEWLDGAKPDPNDGPLVAEIKAGFRRAMS